MEGNLGGAASNGQGTAPTGVHLFEDTMLWDALKCAHPLLQPGDEGTLLVVTDRCRRGTPRTQPRKASNDTSAPRDVDNDIAVVTEAGAKADGVIVG